MLYNYPSQALPTSYPYQIRAGDGQSPQPGYASRHAGADGMLPVLQQPGEHRIRSAHIDLVLQSPASSPYGSYSPEPAAVGPGSPSFQDRRAASRPPRPQPLAEGTRVRAGPSEATWNKLKPVLLDLWMRRSYPLKEVERLMYVGYNFKPTNRMYKTRFKSWGWCKYSSKRTRTLVENHASTGDGNLPFILRSARKSAKVRMQEMRQQQLQSIAPAVYPRPSAYAPSPSSALGAPLVGAAPANEATPAGSHQAPRDEDDEDDELAGFQPEYSWGRPVPPITETGPVHWPSSLGVELDGWDHRAGFASYDQLGIASGAYRHGSSDPASPSSSGAGSDDEGVMSVDGGFVDYRMVRARAAP